MHAESAVLDAGNPWFWENGPMTFVVQRVAPRNLESTPSPGRQNALLWRSMRLLGLLVERVRNRQLVPSIHSTTGFLPAAVCAAESAGQQQSSGQNPFGPELRVGSNGDDGVMGPVEVWHQNSELDKT